MSLRSARIQWNDIDVAKQERKGEAAHWIATVIINIPNIPS